LNIYKNPSKQLFVKAINVSKKYYDYVGFKKLMAKYKTIQFWFFILKTLCLLWVNLHSINILNWSTSYSSESIQ
jgi:hypothetical protein